MLQELQSWREHRNTIISTFEKRALNITIQRLNAKFATAFDEILGIKAKMD
jgi:hypothetical protein